MGEHPANSSSDNSMSVCGSVKSMGREEVYSELIILKDGVAIPMIATNSAGNNSFGHDMGWCKEELSNASDANGDGPLNLTEFNEPYPLESSLLSTLAPLSSSSGENTELHSSSSTKLKTTTQVTAEVSPSSSLTTSLSHSNLAETKKKKDSASIEF
ncbi:Uncharacterized protein Rs2_44578 [Raphanus sativus]|nr:Uncharacterized protein Rs2_44578 [Raphanus sativus]